MLCNCKNYAIELCACKFHDEIPLTWRNAHRGFIYIAVEKLRWWKWWYGSAYCTHKTPISSFRRSGEKIAHIRHKIKLQNLSFVFSDEVESYVQHSKLNFFLVLSLRKNHNWHVSDNQEKWLLPVGQSENLKFSSNHSLEVDFLFARVGALYAYCREYAKMSLTQKVVLTNGTENPEPPF